MAEFRSIHTRIWKDEWFSELEPDAKLLFIYLFSNSQASVCGLYELPMKYMAFETGLDRRRVEELLAQFEQAGKVYYRAGYVWVVNLRKYNETTSPKVATRILKDLETIPAGELKEMYYRYLSNEDRYRIDTLSENDERNRNGDGDNTDTLNNTTTPSSSDDIQAETIFFKVTGMPMIPTSKHADKLAVIDAIRAIRMQHKTDAETITFLQSFYLAWIGRNYSKTNCAWLTEWAVAGKVPPLKASPAKPAAQKSKQQLADDAFAEYERRQNGNG